MKRDLDMQVTPAIFKYKGKELMIDAGKECRIYLMDTESIGGDDHRTPLYRTPLICNEEVNFASAGIWGSMATWEDAKGTRWVLTPFWGPKHSEFKAPIEYGPVKYGAIAAFKVEEKAGKWMLTPAWISRDMNHAEPPVIANGVVFAYGNGEDTDQARLRHRTRVQPRANAHQRFDSRGALRAGRADRQRAVVKRRSDHVVEPLGRTFGRQRARSTSTLSMAFNTALELRASSRLPSRINAFGQPVAARLASSNIQTDDGFPAPDGAGRAGTSPAPYRVMSRSVCIVGKICNILKGSLWQPCWTESWQ